MKASTCVESELEQFSETWKLFKLDLFKSLYVDFTSEPQSLFLLELKSLLLTKDLENHFEVHNDDLTNINNILAKFEDYCFPRILLKFDRFKSQSLHHKLISYNFGHQLGIDEQKITHANKYTDSQIETDFTNQTQQSSFVSDKMSTSIMKVFEKCENLGIFHKVMNSEKSTDTIIPKLFKSEEITLDIYPKILEQSSKTSKSNSIYKEMKHTNVSCNDPSMKSECAGAQSTSGVKPSMLNELPTALSKLPVITTSSKVAEGSDDSSVQVKSGRTKRRSCNNEVSRHMKNKVMLDSFLCQSKNKRKIKSVTIKNEINAASMKSEIKSTGVLSSENDSSNDSYNCISEIIPKEEDNKLELSHLSEDDNSSSYNCLSEIVPNEVDKLTVSHEHERQNNQEYTTCGSAYPNIKTLEDHIKSHTECGKHKCLFCNIEFKQIDHLRIHLLACDMRSSNSKKIKVESYVNSDSAAKQRTKSHFNSEQQSRCKNMENIQPLHNQYRSFKPGPSTPQSESNRKIKAQNEHLRCDVCHCTFVGATKLKRHKLTHVKMKPHNCSLCTAAFASKSHLTAHVQSHSGEKLYICGATFSHKSHLNVHIRSLSGNKPFQCDICGISFTEFSKLKYHKRVHTSEKPHVCEICGSSFAVSSGLKSHMKKHSGEKTFKCKLCQFTSAHASKLRLHLVIHTGEKQFHCDKCRASFSESAKLTRHKMVHSGERPYHCEICGARFADKSHLTAHLRIHAGEKPFKCTFCNSAFVESSKLKNHIRTHTGEKPYVCEICGMTFAVSYSLKSHMRRHTGEKPYKCKVCSYVTSQSSNLKSHMVVHTGIRPHDCYICRASFSKLSQLTRHKEEHHEDDNQNSTHHHHESFTTGVI